MFATMFAALCLFFSANAQSLLWSKHYLNLKPMETFFKRWFVIGIVTVFTASSAMSQTFQWENHYSTNTHKDIKAGGDGRIYVCNNAASLICLTPAGVQSWATPYTPAGGCIGGSIATYGTGTNIVVYMAGQEGIPGNGTDMFLNKYNSSGVLQWTKNWGTAAHESAMHVTVDGVGNVYATGIQGGMGAENIFTRAYDSSGNLLWSLLWNGSGNATDMPQETRVNGSYFYIAGYTTSTGGNEDALLIKVNLSTGAIVWTSVWNNPVANGADRVNSLAFGLNESVYTVGRSYVNSTNGHDALLLLHNNAGTVTCYNLWNNASVSMDDEFGSVATSQASKATQVYATGYTTAGLGAGNTDVLTVHYYTNCNLGWVNIHNGNNPSCPFSVDIGYQVLYSNNTNKVYVTARTDEAAGHINYTTIRYDASSGVQDWFATYDRASAPDADNMPPNKYPMAIQYDACHLVDEIYVIGYTYTTAAQTAANGTTIKYGLSGPCSQRLGAPHSNNDKAGTNLYPNPFSASATFQCDLDAVNNASFIIYDVTGREVERMDNICTPEFEVKSDKIDNGIYFYRFVQGESIISSGKFIVKK